MHECGVAAVYHLNNAGLSPLIPRLKLPDRTVVDPATEDPQAVRNRASRLVPGMLLDMQNRGQLAAGMTSFSPGRSSILATHKDLGTVAEAFRLNAKPEFEALMSHLGGPAAIGHVRYATCGTDDHDACARQNATINMHEVHFDGEDGDEPEDGWTDDDWGYEGLDDDD